MTNISDNWLSELNQQQRTAVTNTNGPLLVVAGAGSGKTRTLAYKVAYLISQGVDPERILLLTFTRRAANEMISRAAQAISMSSSSVNQVWGGTFHAIANRLLRIYAQTAGISPDFTIIDQSDAADSIDIIRHKKSFTKLNKRFPRKGTCLAVYSRCMNSSDDLAQILKVHFPWCEQWKDKLKELFKEYVIYKQGNNILDYDDLLLYLYHLLGNKSVANAIEQRFEYILVDEYQDTNRLQANILYRLRQSNTNIMAVGDDAQSIYSFRSASIQNMLDFPKKYPHTVIVKLEQNYRSTKYILKTTNSMIEQSKECFHKTLYTNRETGQHPQLITCKDESHENETVIQHVLKHYEQGIPLHNQAVLFRASSHSNSLEIALTQKNIPFHKYGGLRFLEASHVKDLISILRILENPRDEMAWFRILKLFDGIGPATASHIFEHVKQNS
ncbi:MAG: ATP-dependent helicase, partial [Chitinispirillia bacterium]